MIGEGDHGILVIIKDTNAIRALKRSEGQDIKITVTQFGIKDGCMMTDDTMSSVEVDDHLMNEVQMSEERLQKKYDELKKRLADTKKKGRQIRQEICELETKKRKLDHDEKLNRLIDSWGSGGAAPN